MPEQVAQGVYSIGRDRIEIYAIEEGGKLTLIDSGLKSDWDHIGKQVTALGKTLADIEAVVLTHAHLDHYGSAERLRTDAGAAVHVHESDLMGIQGGPVEGKTPNPLKYLPGALLSLFNGIRKGMLGKAPPVLEASTFADGQSIDVPGRPRAIHVPGHTRGSAALHIQERDVLFSGDALVTYGFMSRKTGPRLSEFNADPQQALDSLANLDGITASLVLPGHGAPWREGVTAAVEVARRNGLP